MMCVFTFLCYLLTATSLVK